MNNNLFDKIPENFFSVLSRKYKSVYALALLTLYETLKTYKVSIKKTDYLNMLTSRISDSMSLFSVALDRLDDKDDEKIESAADVNEELTPSKISYIVKKLEKTGWIELEKDVKTNTEYIFLPSYSIKMIELLNSLSSDVSFYLPLVHQTYSELKLEDEKEDEFMFRAVLNARKNADELELNVTLLHHSIYVFGHKLTTIFSPNEALHQHFDNFQTEITDKIYHPMKTFDSLNLYALPTIKILTRWMDDDRLINKMVMQARADSQFAGKSHSEIVGFIITNIRDTIDVYRRLQKSFDEIDKTNAEYTAAVQKKVNYLSSSDKTIIGKIKSILVRAAKEIKNNPDKDYDEMEFLQQMGDTISIYQQGYIDQDSLTPPFKRSVKEEFEPESLPDPFSGDMDFDDLGLEELNKYGPESVDNFMSKAFGKKNEITTGDIDFQDFDDFILFILAEVRAELQISFYKMERVKEQEEIIKQGFRLPNFVFTRKELLHV